MPPGLVYSFFAFRYGSRPRRLQCAQLELTYVDVSCAEKDWARIAASPRSEDCVLKRLAVPHTLDNASGPRLEPLYFMSAMKHPTA
jgi:hypothetical protein